MSYHPTLLPYLDLELLIDIVLGRDGLRRRHREPRYDAVVRGRAPLATVVGGIYGEAIGAAPVRADESVDAIAVRLPDALVIIVELKSVGLDAAIRARILSE